MVKNRARKRRERYRWRTGEDRGRIDRRREVEKVAGAHRGDGGVDVARVDRKVVVVDRFAREKRGLGRLLKELQEESAAAVLGKGGGGGAATGFERIQRCSAAFGHGNTATGRLEGTREREREESEKKKEKEKGSL